MADVWMVLFWGGIVPILKAVAELIKTSPSRPKGWIIRGPVLIAGLILGVVVGTNVGYGWGAGLVSGLCQALTAFGLYHWAGRNRNRANGP